MIVPLDIVDHILSFLQPDHPSLISCWKAHPLFSSLAERHFFAETGLRNFTVSTPNPFFYHSDLCNILSIEPHIANYIRTLYIELGAPGIDQNRAEAYRETSLILANLPLLHKIVIYSNVEGTLTWDDLDESFNNALIKCLQLPTLKKFSVAISSFPLNMLDSFHSLDELSLVCSIQPSSSRQPVDTLRLNGLQLNSLRLSRYPTSQIALIMAILGNCLRSLVLLNFGDKDVVFLAQMPIGTLKELTLDLSSAFITQYSISDKTFTVPISRYSEELSLAQLPNLERLTIHILISLYEWRNVRYCSYSLPTVLQVLRTLTCPPLEHPTLQVTIKLAQSFTIHHVNWSPLTDLASLHFRSPVRLSVSVVDDYVSVNLDDVAHTLNENPDLSSLIKPGQLSIDVVSLHPNPLRLFY